MVGLVQVRSRFGSGGLFDESVVTGDGVLGSSAVKVGEEIRAILRWRRKTTLVQLGRWLLLRYRMRQMLLLWVLRGGEIRDGGESATGDGVEIGVQNARPIEFVEVGPPHQHLKRGD